MSTEKKTYQTSREVFAAHIPGSPTLRPNNLDSVKQESSRLSHELLQSLQSSLAKLPTRSKDA